MRFEGWLTYGVAIVTTVVLGIGVVGAIALLVLFRRTPPLSDVKRTSLNGALELLFQEASRKTAADRRRALFMGVAHTVLVVGEFGVGLFLITAFVEQVVGKAGAVALGFLVLVALFLKYFFRLELMAALARLRATKREELMTQMGHRHAQMKEGATPINLGGLLDEFYSGLREIDGLHV